MTPGQMNAIVHEKQTATVEWSAAMFPHEPSTPAPAQKCLPDQDAAGEQDINSAENMDDTEDNEEFLEKLISITSKNLPKLEVEERYNITRELGSGSYGHVLQVQHRERDAYFECAHALSAGDMEAIASQGEVFLRNSAGTSMALKLMSKEHTGRREFLWEYCIALCLSSHPTLLRTIGSAFESSTHYGFSQELAPAGDLCSILNSGEGLPEVQVKRCAAQLADALDFMHGKALVHRDIKLDNVLLFDQECQQLKLGDFGLTRLEGTCISAMSAVLPYSPPELCLLERTESLALDSSLDIWAFGVLLFCICTGCIPWDMAMSPDPKFEEFSIWQNRTIPGEAPGLWKVFTAPALRMFCRIMALDPNRRSPAIEVNKYLHLPWRVGTSEKIQDDLLKTISSEACLKGPSEDNTELGRNLKENCLQQMQPEVIPPEKTHTIQMGPNPGSNPSPHEGSSLNGPGLEP